MNDAKWVNELQQGSEVAYGHYYFGRPVFKFSKVMSVSPSRSVITLESGDKFNQNGDERGKNVDDLHRRWLCKPQEARRVMDAYASEVPTN